MARLVDIKYIMRFINQMNGTSPEVAATSSTDYERSMGFSKNAWQPSNSGPPLSIHYARLVDAVRLLLLTGPLGPTLCQTYRHICSRCRFFVRLQNRLGERERERSHARSVVQLVNSGHSMTQD